MAYFYTSRWDGDQIEQYRTMLDGRQSLIWTMLPGIVQSVNFKDMTCEVQPAIKMNVRQQDGTLQQTQLPVIPKAPILFPGGGQYFASFPLQAGDEVMIVFACRCVDAWWQSGGIQAQIESRRHDLTDGFVIPKLYSVPKVPTMVSTTTAQLRSFDGTVFAEVDQPNGQVHFKAPTQVLVDAPLLQVNGQIKATGNVTANSTGSPVDLINHTHLYIPGSNTAVQTNPPTPGT